MNDNYSILTVFLCYSINPFIRKMAIINLNDYTGYALIQLTTTTGNLFYLTQNSQLFCLHSISKYNLRYSICSSLLTVLSSYHMTKLLKNNSTSKITSQIQVLTIVTSFLVDYLFNKQVLNNKEILGIFFMLAGISLTKNSTN